MKNALSENLLKAILDDQVSTFSDLLAQFESVDVSIDFGKALVPEILLGNPPIISIASFFGSKMCVEHLIARQACLSLTDDMFKRAPMHYAFAGGCLDIVRTFDSCNMPLDVMDVNGLLPLHYACEFGHLDIVRYYFSKGFSLESTNKLQINPILVAAKSGKSNIIDFLAKKGLNIQACDHQGHNALHYAAYGGYPCTIRFLISMGIDPNRIGFQNETPLIIACENGHLEVAKALCENGSKFKLNKRKTVPIVSAARYGHLDIVKFFLSLGVCINSITSAGETPLISAYVNNQKSMVMYLLNNGASVFMSNNVLFLALDNLDLEFFKIFVHNMSPDTNIFGKLLLKIGDGLEEYKKIVELKVII